MVIMNDNTLEEKASLVLSPLNVFVVIGSTALFLIITVIYVIAFTPLREYIPGYADVNMRKNIARLTLKADSLEQELKAKDLYLKNLNNIISGRVDEGIEGPAKDTTAEYQKLSIQPSKEDSALREEIEKTERFSLTAGPEASTRQSINSFFFFVPLQGTVTSSFETSADHFGVDIVAPKNEAIKATLDGTVILAAWTSETGYVIQIQHDNNDLVSIYKHNSVLLKKVGDRVEAGDVIAIVGESGELTTGPHLHFELWYNGEALNPQEYISF